MKYITIQIKISLEHSLFLNTETEKHQFIQTIINLISKQFIRKTFLRTNDFKITHSSS